MILYFPRCITIAAGLNPPLGPHSCVFAGWLPLLKMPDVPVEVNTVVYKFLQLPSAVASDAVFTAVSVVS